MSVFLHPDMSLCFLLNAAVISIAITKLRRHHDEREIGHPVAPWESFTHNDSAWIIIPHDVNITPFSSAVSVQTLHWPI